MDKGTKIGLVIGLGIVTIIVAVLAWPIYFVSQFSATYPHLKDYTYPLTVRQLEKEIIEVIKSDTSFKYVITDSTGTNVDRNYYMTIDQNFSDMSLSYHITYSRHYFTKSTLGLVGVFDKTNKSGGYLNTDKDVQKLISIFDNQVIDKINKGGR